MNEQLQTPYPIVTLGSLPDKTPVLIPVTTFPEHYIDYNDCTFRKIALAEMCEDNDALALTRLVPEGWTVWYHDSRQGVRCSALRDLSDYEIAYIPAMVNKDDATGTVGVDILVDDSLSGYTFLSDCPPKLCLNGDAVVFHLHDIRYAPCEPTGVIQKVHPIVMKAGAEETKHIKNVYALTILGTVQYQ